MSANREGEHDDVFGGSFSRFSQEDMEPFVGNLAERFHANGLDPRTYFEGASCLDAGCGGGRGSLFMAGHGAASVDAIDVSSRNVATAERNAAALGFSNIVATEGSIEQLPYETGSFDVVWCYGVVHHTANPDKCLSELARALKIGGRMVLFVYGTGGILWYVVYRARRFVDGVGIDACRAVLDLCDTELNMTTSIMDNWKVPYLRAYEERHLLARADELGLAPAERLQFGMPWDTNHRRKVHVRDADWVGGGDLRFILEKTLHATSEGTHHSINTENIAPDSRYDARILEVFEPLFDELDAVAAPQKLMGLLAHRQAFLRVAEALRSKGPFDWPALAGYLHDLSRDLRQVKQALE